MAAPDSATIQNLSGDWVMSKKLSGPFDQVLQLQGVSWVLRKLIGSATITLHVKQYKDDQGVDHIDITQTGTAGIKGTTELRALDSQYNEHEDYIFGHVKGRSKWTQLSELKDDDEDHKFLKSGWDKSTLDGGVVMDSYVENLKDHWTAHQAWGFQDVDVDGKKERRYSRNIVAKNKEGKTVRIRTVYDYQGPSKQ